MDEPTGFWTSSSKNPSGLVVGQNANVEDLFFLGPFCPVSFFPNPFSFPVIRAAEAEEKEKIKCEEKICQFAKVPIPTA